MKYTSRLIHAGLVCAVALVGTGCAEKAPEVAELTPQEILSRAADRMAVVESFAFVMEHENGFTPIMQGLEMERAEGRISEGNRISSRVKENSGETLRKVRSNWRV
jgi:hypothetical protein